MDFIIENKNKLIRIGVFYDGNYFSHVSNYYYFYHSRKARISIPGLHRFLMSEIAREEGVSIRHCRIVDAHYFRGRLSASEAKSRDALYRERIFEEVLMREGIVTHYLPLSGGGEKGVDVWLALEAFELSIYKRFDVIVLIAGDGDYLPLIKKLNTIGSRVMILGWNFEYQDNNGISKITRTAKSILEESTYPRLMSKIIDERDDKEINDLFFKPKSHNESDIKRGFVEYIDESKGYGFIKSEQGEEQIFFHISDLLEGDFELITPGYKVEFELTRNEKGLCAKKVHLLERTRE